MCSSGGKTGCHHLSPLYIPYTIKLKKKEIFSICVGFQMAADAEITDGDGTTDGIGTTDGTGITDGPGTIDVTDATDAAAMTADGPGTGIPDGPGTAVAATEIVTVTETVTVTEIATETAAVTETAVAAVASDSFTDDLPEVQNMFTISTNRGHNW